MKRLYRSGKERMLGGVCGGFAEYLDVDPSLIRIAFVVVLVLSMGLAILVYIAAWILIPGPEAESLQQVPESG